MLARVWSALKFLFRWRAWRAAVANRLLNMYQSFLRKIRSSTVRRKLLRSTIAVVVVLVLLIHPVTSQVFGSGTLFLSTLVVTMPPFLPSSVHIVLMIVLLLCLVITSAWTCAATAAAFSIRSPSLLLKQVQSARSAYIQGIPTQIQDQNFINSGHFLDPRSSAVFGVFFFFGTFFLAIALGQYPGATILGIIALILMDSSFMNGPLMPTKSYSGSVTYLVSAACYAAVSIACLVVILPESFNHSWLITAREEILIPIIVFLGKDSHQASDLSAHMQFLQRVEFAIQMIEDRKQALNFEFSVHRLSPEEHFALYDWIKCVVNRVKNLERLQRLVIALLEENKYAGYRKSNHAPNFDGSYSYVFEACSDLRLACRIALMEIDEWIQECTKDSWSSVFTAFNRRKADFRHLKLNMSRLNLRKAQAKILKKGKWPDFVYLAKNRIRSPQREGALEMRNAVIVLSYMDNIDLLATELEGIITFLLDIEEREPKPVPRLPRIFMRPSKRETSDDSRTGSPSFTVITPSPTLKGDDKSGHIVHSSSVPHSSSSCDTKMLVSQTVEFTGILSGPPSVSSPPSLRSGAESETSGSKMTKALRLLLKPVTIFAFRFSLMSVALFSLGVSKSTAAFFNSNSGVLSIILGQSYLTIYAGEQIYFFLTRFSGTLLGLLLVIPAWYMSAGKGTGNPYVLVVITTILVIPSLLVTVSTNNRNHLFFAMFASSTLLSTLTLIWSETRASGSSTTEIVFRNIWSRALLDVLGFAASLVVAMLPKPFTVRHAFHETLGQALTEVESFLRTNSEWDTSSRVASVDASMNLLFSLEKKQVALEHFTTSMKFDPRISRLPSSAYQRITYLQALLVSSAMNYIGGVERLNHSFRRNFSSQIPSLNQSKVQRVLHRISNLAETFASSSEAPLLGLQNEKPNEVLSSMRLPANLPHNEMLICSSVAINFATITESVRELELLLAGISNGSRSSNPVQEVEV